MVEEGDKDDASRSEKQQTGKSQQGWSGPHVGVSQTSREHEFSVVHKTMHEEMKDHIVLDNGSALSLFGNAELVKDIRQSKNKLPPAANAGVKENNKKANVPEFGDVWFDQEAIANIFGFADVKKKHRIAHDSNKEDAFLAHTDHGIAKFEASPQGLC